MCLLHKCILSKKKKEGKTPCLLGLYKIYSQENVMLNATYRMQSIVSGVMGCKTWQFLILNAHSVSVQFPTENL